ncbi:Mitogen-activated protein kinase kinase kinase YODA [Hibiscus syriacus]|uniref:mitogen-activated protein kinase kinase kinase n=1 Tax=Hibiscus syriacus TaxID=106335 RepID=A0A6A3BEK8_HIBSY|nr:Mitogen-activated protein kinase kinase kinase YODA [Hibiscus syriacus]
MPISRKNFPLISSSLPSSGSHIHDNAGKTGNSCNNQAQQQRRLTRQRRLRHLTDDEVGLRFGDIPRSFSSPCSPDTPAAKDSRSPERLDHWSSYAEPKPLPLPEVFNQSLLSRRRGFPHEKDFGSVNHNLRLNVPPGVLQPRELNAHPLPLPPGAFQSSQSPKPLPSPVPKHISEKPIATSIISQWKKGRLLGRGTYGSVYEATNRETGALCAMKEVDIIPDDPKSVECVKQLEQEIRMLKRLKHRNIVQYYDSELVDDHFYIYLEYVHPGPINKYVREHCGAITESIVRNFTRHILSGLAFLHSSNTIHRDIKGANLLVDANGVVKLADFGMAKHLTGLSYELSLKGSPYWMAPEVLKSVMKKDSNPNLALAVDIWSLGCTVIEMLNGKPPWSDFEGPQALFKVLNQNPTVPDALSPEGKDFLHCCFQRNPAERPSAAMLLEHPFVRNSADQQGPALVQPFSRMNPTDNSHSERIEMMSTSPGTRITKGKSPSNSVTGLSGYARTNNCAAASHLSPYTSAARVIHGSHSFSPSSHVSSNIALDAVNNHPFAVGRT